MNKRKLIIQFLIFDVLAAIIVWILFMIFRKIVNDGIIFNTIKVLVPNYNFFTSLLLFPSSCVFIHYLSGFYLRPYRQSRLMILLTTFTASFIISICIFFVLLIDDNVESYVYYYYSLLVLFGLLFFISSIFRTLIISHISKNFRTKKWTENTIIIGTGANAIKMADEISKKALYESFIGYVSAYEDEEIIVSGNILGKIDQIGSIIEQNKVEEAIIVLENSDEKKLFSVINALFPYNISIKFSPRLYEILTGSVRINRIDMGPLVSITELVISDWETSMKRFIDIVLSTLSIIILSPLLAVFAIRIKTDSKGSVFYKQERIGRFGKPFNILKFRTMISGAENGTPQLSSPNDGRITKTGRFLRKYRLDELPQFWNVLKGDMSLVGPRPERQFYIEQIVEQAPYYCLLYKIRPGLTSWGPIKVGYSDSIEKMIERLNYDIIYMDNMSLLTDMKIILYTLEILFKGKGI